MTLFQLLSVTNSIIAQGGTSCADSFSLLRFCLATAYKCCHNCCEWVCAAILLCLQIIVSLFPEGFLNLGKKEFVFNSYHLFFNLFFIFFPSCGGCSWMSTRPCVELIKTCHLDMSVRDFFFLIRSFKVGRLPFNPDLLK